MELDHFLLRVAKALSGCQAVELLLKVYITEALNLARRCIAGRMTFKFSGDEYNDASLERLIQGFRKLTTNDELMKRLNAFKDERNFLSHKCITSCLDHEGELFLSSATEIQPRLAAIEKEAAELQSAIFYELQKVQVMDFHLATSNTV